MKFKTIAEAFNHYRTSTLEEIECRAAEIKNIVATDATADVDALNIELEGLSQAKQNVQSRAAGGQQNSFNPVAGAGMTFERRASYEATEGDVFNSAEYRSAFMKRLLGRKLNSFEEAAFNRAMTEQRADAYGTSGNVAAVLPTQTLNEVISKARTMGGIMSVCRSFNVPSKIAIPVGTPAAAASWHTEGAAVDSAAPSVATVSFDGYEIMKVLSISVKVQSMSIAAFESYLVEELTNCVMACIADGLVNGTGSSQGTMLAGIALYMMIADREAGAEIYCVATKRDQARLIFEEAYNMIKQSPQLRELVRKRKGDLYFANTFSKMEALSKDSGSMDGLNSHCVVIDELHGIKDRNLYEVMKQSQSARRQPLLIMITTAGTIRENIFDEMYATACNIVDGVFKDDTFLPILYELDSREEWTQPEAWQKANPALGTIKKIDDLQTKVARAQNNPNELRGLLVKDFNIKDTLSTAWLSYEDIDNAETFDLARFKNKFAIGGADLSKTLDLTCATLLMIDKDTGKRCVTQMYWIPEETLERRVAEEKIPYDKWRDRGLLRTCAGNTINYKDVTAWFLEMAAEYKIVPAWVYYDAWSARYWVEEMKASGFNMIPCIQGAKTLSLPMQNMGADLQAKRIVYNNHPILKWCLTNTGVKTDVNGNIVPVKNQAAKQRIDGMASLLDAYVGLTEKYEEYIRTL